MPFCFLFCCLVDPSGMIVLPPRLISLAVSRSYLLGLVIEQFLSNQDSISAKSCLEETACTYLPAFTICSSCLASLYGIRVFHGRRTRGIGSLPKLPLILLLFIYFCCVLARTGFVPCFRVHVPFIAFMFSLMCFFQRRRLLTHSPENAALSTRN